MVSRISKISLSASRASQASLCSLSTVDQIANLLPSVTKPCNASSCLSVCTPFEKLCASLKARTPLSQLWPQLHYYSQIGWQSAHSLNMSNWQPRTYYVDVISGVSSMELRVLEHPPQLWHNSQLSTSAQILSMIIDNWQLLPTINLLASKIRSLNSVFSSPLGLKQPSLSASYLQECVNKGPRTSKFL